MTFEEFFKYIIILTGVFVVLMVVNMQYMFKLELQIEKIKTALIINGTIPNTIFDEKKGINNG